MSLKVISQYLYYEGIVISTKKNLHAVNRKIRVFYFSAVRTSIILVCSVSEHLRPHPKRYSSSAPFLPLKEEEEEEEKKEKEMMKKKKKKKKRKSRD